MFETFLEAFVYYGACTIGIVMLVSFISLTFGGSFAGELLVIVSGLGLCAFLDLSLAEIVSFCLISNLVFFLWRRLRNHRGFVGEWRDEIGCYLLNIKATDEEFFVETNLFNDNDFDIELSKRSIKLISSTESCLIKKRFFNKLELTLGSKSLILHREDCQRAASRVPNIVTAKQLALLGVTLEVIVAIVQKIMQGESNHYLFLEVLLNKMIMYATYGFGYIFSLCFFTILSDLTYNIADFVISISPSVTLLAIFITITLIIVVYGLAFIPGIFIGIKALLDEIA